MAERSGGGQRYWLSDDVIGSAAAAAAFIGVGLSVVATRFAIAQSDALTLAFMRNGVAFVLLYPFLRRAAHGAEPVKGPDLAVICLFGLSSFMAFPLLFTAALRYAPATHGALALPAATPVLTLALATALRREKFDAFKAVGVLLAALGVVAALVDTGAATSAAPGDSGKVWLGDTLMLLAAATIAIYNVFTRPYLNKYGTLRLLSIALGAGSAALLMLVVGSLLLGRTGWPVMDRNGWIAVAVVCIASALSNWLWSWALSRTTPTRVAVFMTLNPLVAMALAILLLGEPASTALGIGLVLVLAGIVLVNLPVAAIQRRRPSAGLERLDLRS